MSRSAVDVVAAIRNDALFPGNNGRRRWFTIKPDGSLGRAVGDQSSVYPTTSRSWYTKIGWSNSYSFTSGTQTSTFSTAVRDSEGKIVAMTLGSIVASEARCVAARDVDSFAVRAVNAALGTMRAARGVRFAARAATKADVSKVVTKLVAVYDKVNGGADPSIGFATRNGNMYRVVSCLWGHTKVLACSKAGGGVAKIAVIANKRWQGTYKLQYYKVTAGGELGDQITMPEQDFNVTRAAFWRSVAGFTRDDDGLEVFSSPMFGVDGSGEDSGGRRRRRLQLSASDTTTVQATAFATNSATQPGQSACQLNSFAVSGATEVANAVYNNIDAFTKGVTTTQGNELCCSGCCQWALLHALGCLTPAPPITPYSCQDHWWHHC